MSDNKCMDKRCEGCNPHFPGQLKRCPTCNGLCSTCLKRRAGTVPASKAAAPVAAPTQEAVPKKKHTGLVVFLVIIGILAVIAIILAILFAVGVLGFDSSTMWDSTHFFGVFVSISP